MKTKEELEKSIKDTITKYKEIVFGADSPACVACLDELQKQQVINKKVYDQKLMDDAVRKLAWDHKITCCKTEELHVLSGTDTLYT